MGFIRGINKGARQAVLFGEPYSLQQPADIPARFQLDPFFRVPHANTAMLIIP